MEIGAREAIQFISIIAALAGAFAVCRSQLSRVVDDLTKLSREMRCVEQRLDDGQAQMAVYSQQLSVLGEINSPTNLERHHRELARTQGQIDALRERVSDLLTQHNGQHKSINSK
jgi:polyhydroxyalkanoate synthesis regulator phasin